jgi:hypothetical protein
MKNINKLFIGVCIVALSMGFVQSDSWFVLQATDLGFSIEFPVEPQKTNQVQTTEAGDINVYTYSYEPNESAKDDNIDYELVCTTMPISIEPNTSNTKVSDGMFKKTIDAIVKSTKGKALSDKPLKFNGYPGKEVRIERKYKHEVYIMKLKLYFIKNKFFIIESTTTEAKQYNKSGTRFFASFKLLS